MVQPKMPAGTTDLQATTPYRLRHRSAWSFKNAAVDATSFAEHRQRSMVNPLTGIAFLHGRSQVSDIACGCRDSGAVIGFVHRLHPDLHNELTRLPNKVLT